MINQEDLVLKDIERCKKVQPIMDRLGIEPDGYHVIQTENNYELIKSSEVHLILSTYQSDLEYANDQISWSKGGTLYEFQEAFKIVAKTYRQDKLALALPDWCFGWFRLPLPNEIIDLITAQKMKSIETKEENDTTIQIAYNLQTLMKRRGKAQLEATADLLILLEEQQLLKKEKK